MPLDETSKNIALKIIERIISDIPKSLESSPNVKAFGDQPSREAYIFGFAWGGLLFTIDTYYQQAYNRHLTTEEKRELAAMLANRMQDIRDGFFA